MNNIITELGIKYSDGFCDWLYQKKCTLLLSTYQLGKVLAIGTDEKGELLISERTFHKPMGIAVGDNAFYLATSHQIIKFSNFLKEGKRFKGFQKVFVPKTFNTTGDIDAHELTVNKEDTWYVASSKFNCIATKSDSYSFKPHWEPKFISQLVPKDLCHINGIASVNQKPKYVSLFGQKAENKKWRDFDEPKGQIIDIDSGQLVGKNLNMPHSPRWYLNRLWCLNSGDSTFGTINTVQKKFKAEVQLTGFARGLCFLSGNAIIGTSKFRNDNPQTNHKTSSCGISIINLSTMKIVEHLHFQKHIFELFDVQLIPNCQSALLIGEQSDEIKRIYSFD